MADSKLTALTAITSASSDDLLYIVDDPGGSPLSRKITVGNLLSSSNAVTASANLTDDAVLRGDGGAKGIQTSTISLSDAGILAPITNDAGTLGSGTKMWSDLFLADGGVINFNNGDVTITNSSANVLAFAGSLVYIFDAEVRPSVDNTTSLGSGSNNWSDLFLGSGAVINFNFGDVTLTHSSNLLTIAGGNLMLQSALVLEDPGAGSFNITMQAPTLAASYTLTLPTTDGTANQFLQTDGSGVLTWTTVAGTGDVVGPGSATDNAFARFDGTTGKLIQNSVVIGDDSGNVTGVVAQTNTGLLTITRAGVPLDVQNSTDAASNQMAIFRAGDRATPAALDEGYISFYLDGSAGSHVEFGRLTVVATTITTASRASEIIIGPYFNGSATARAGFGVDYFAPLTAFSTQYDLGSTTRLFRNLYLMESAQIVCGNNLAALQFNDTVIGVSGANFSAPNVQINNGGGLRPTTTSGHAMHIQIYDTDLGDYVNAASTINANSPNLDFKEAYVTMNSNVIYRAAGTDVARLDGGTGASLTDPNVDAFYFWDDSAGATINLAPSTTIINDTTLLLLSGVWTPTRSAEVNMDANVTMFEGQYMRLGATVMFSGRFTADPTLTATPTSFEMSLPVASNFGAVEDCAGTAISGAIAGMGAQISGSVANNTMVVTWVASDINSQSWSFSGSYQVI